MESLKEIFSTKEIEYGMEIHRIANEKFMNILKDYGVECKEVLPFNAYPLYPYFFVEDYQGIDDDTIVRLGVAGMLYYLYITFYDNYVDTSRDIANVEKLVISTIGQKSVIELTEIIGEQNKMYFKYMDKYMHEYINALLNEINIEEGISDLHYFEKIFKGKSAIAKCFSAALGVMTKNYSKIDMLERTQDYFSNALQMYDDIKDIKEDVRKGQKTYVLSRIDTGLNVDMLYDDFMKTGEFKNSVNYIITNLNRSLITAGQTGSWYRNIHLFQRKIYHLYEDVLSERFLPEIKGFNTKLSVDTVMSRIEDLVIKCFDENGLKEIVHYMLFKNCEGYAGDELKEGMTFMLAYTLNNMLACKKFPQNRVDLTKVLKYYNENKTQLYFGGWTYFPNLQELAPDIDTLSEILRLGVELKNPELKKYIKDVLVFVLNNLVMEDGGIRTWIISSNNMSSQEEIATRYAIERWGIRCDAEVTANFIYSLLFSDMEIEKDVYDKSLKWIASLQNEDGSWTSSWYVGKYYGTYVSVRAMLNCREGDSYRHSLEKAQEFILNTFNGYGWSIGNRTDVQSTSFAVMTLLDLYHNNFVDYDTIEMYVTKAKEFLLHQFDGELGFYHKIPFICMAQEKMHGKMFGEDVEFVYDVEYQSNLLTTSIVYRVLSYIDEV